MRRLRVQRSERGANVVGGLSFRRRRSLRNVPAYVDAIETAFETALDATPT